MSHEGFAVIGKKSTTSGGLSLMGCVLLIIIFFLAIAVLLSGAEDSRKWGYIIYSIISLPMAAVCLFGFLRNLNLPNDLILINKTTLIINMARDSRAEIPLAEISGVQQKNARARFASYSFGKLKIITYTMGEYVIKDLSQVDAVKTAILLALPRKIIE